MRGLGTVLLVLLAHVPASRTVSLRARAGETAMVVEGGEMRFKPLQEDAPGGLTVIGKLHRCTYTGPADQLSVYLSDAQKGKNPDDFYFTRKRSDGYWQHLFIESECTGGLPPQDSPCLSSRHKGQHCGRDEDWSVLANDDFDGPGVLWRNEETCDPMQHNTNASITVDYFCPNQDNCKFLHRCSYDGPPKPVSQVAVLMDQKLNSNDHYSGNAAAGQVNDGYMAHTFAPAHCQNGLPPKGKDVSCVTSLRWAESCGGDHDWQALSRNDPAGPGVKWYTSHECNMARVAVDYFCPVGPTGGEFKKRLHTCKYKGPSDLDVDAARCEAEVAPGKGVFGEVRHAGGPPPGMCMHHVFKEDECTNGLPRGNCFASFARMIECGDEQDWTILAPGDTPGVRAAALWYQALPGGPCGDADVQIDYYCFGECVRECKNGGVLDVETCSCQCPKDGFWTGFECQMCGAEQSVDCPAGTLLDKADCTCKGGMEKEALARVTGVQGALGEAVKRLARSRATIGVGKAVVAARVAKEKLTSANKNKALADAAQAEAAEVLAAAEGSMKNLTAVAVQKAVIAKQMGNADMGIGNVTTPAAAPTVDLKGEGVLPAPAAISSIE